MTPLVIAHRGASGREYENSPAAFLAAREAQADGVELDIYASRDGHLIVHHDPVIPGWGRIAESTLAEIRRARLPNGEAIPCLAEILEILPGTIVWVEIKALPETSDGHLLETLAAGPTPSSYAVHSFDHRIIKRLGAKDASLKRGILSASRPIDPVSQVRQAWASTLWQESTLIDPTLVSEIHAIGAEIVAWTVNTEADARRLADIGVDGLCGNYPERLRLV